MSEDLSEYKLVGTYSAGLTITQMQQHPSEQKLFSQLTAQRAWWKMIGRFAYLGLTDHAQLVRLCTLALERIDPKHFRWFQEISANGSELCHIPGRCMRLGDGFSRNPEHRDALMAMLEARNGDLRKMQVVIRGFDLEEHQSSEPWEGQLHPPQVQRNCMGMARFGLPGIGFSVARTQVPTSRSGWAAA